jgi:hypothetical protein
MLWLIFLLFSQILESQAMNHTDLIYVKVQTKFTDGYCLTHCDKQQDNFVLSFAKPCVET